MTPSTHSRKIKYPVLLLVLLTSPALADKKSNQDRHETERKKEESPDRIEARVSTGPRKVQKLQTAAGVIAPVAYGYGGAKGGGGNVQQFYEPKPYRFGYEIKDPRNGKSFRHEQDDGSGTKRGSYGYTDPHGLFRVVDYVADHNGFRAAIRTNEPGTTSSNPAHINILSEYQPVFGGGKGYGAAPVPQIKIPSVKFEAPREIVRFANPQPQPIKFAPPIRFAPPQEPQTVQYFAPPAPQLQIAKPPPLFTQHEFASQPANILNSRPQVQYGGPLIHHQPLVKFQSTNPVHTGGFANQQFQQNTIQTYQNQQFRVVPVQTRPFINAGPIQGPIFNRGPIINQGPIGGLHIGGGPVQGPIITPAPARGYQIQQIPVQHDVGTVKISGGAPIISGPGVGHVLVQQPQRIIGLTGNSITGGLRKGIRAGFIQGLRGGLNNGFAQPPAPHPQVVNIRGPFKLVKGFKQGFRSGLAQRLKGAHSGESGQGTRAILPPIKNPDQTIFLGPFPNTQEGKEISHIVSAPVQGSSSGVNIPSYEQKRQISRIVLIKMPEPNNSRQPVEVPGGDPAFIGPGPAPKFDPMELKNQFTKKAKEQAKKRKEDVYGKRIAKPRKHHPPKLTTTTPAPIEHMAKYKPPLTPTRKPKTTIEFEFTLPFGK